MYYERKHDIPNECLVLRNISLQNREIDMECNGLNIEMKTTIP